MKAVPSFQPWLTYLSFGLLALVAPALLVYDLVFQLSAPGIPTPDPVRLATATGVVVIFWSFTGFLLLRRFHQGFVRLLYVHGQVLAVTMVYPLAHPGPWDEPPGLLSLSIAGFYCLAPLTLHMHLSFPVSLGSPRQRGRVLRLLYLATLAALLGWLSGSSWLRHLGELYTILIFTLSIAVLIYAYVRRATSDSRRRLRIIWIGTLLAIVPANALYFVPGLYGWPAQIPVWLVGLLLVMVPLSYLYAITHQNLFGIDRLLNRTLVYLLLAASLFAVYLLPLVYLYNRLSIGWLGQALVSAGLTLAIGWNFSWLRTLTERLVDRVFYGGWYDFPAVVGTVSDALARSLERQQVSEVLTRQVPELMRLHPGSLTIGAMPSQATIRPEPPHLEFHFELQGGLPANWMVAGHRDGEDFSAGDRRILKTLARQAKVALNNVILVEALRSQLAEIRASRASLGLLQGQLLRSREEERARLARELHDGPLQTLIGMNMQLGVLISNEPAGDGALQELRAEVRSLLEDLRAVCSQLRPPMLDILGLGAALRVLAEEWSQQHGIALQLDLPADAGLRDLPVEVAVNLYRVVQEALTNIARHAGAESVWLGLRRDGNCYVLNIQDDGRGFHVPDALHDLAAQDHFGLVGMHERVALIGGSLAVESAPGQGTRVQVRM